MAANAARAWRILDLPGIRLPLAASDAGGSEERDKRAAKTPQLLSDAWTRLPDTQQMRSKRGRQREHMRSAIQTGRLARKHLERRLAPWRNTSDLARPARGWVRAIREALGMSSAQLGRRIGVSQSRVTRIEKDEARDVLTLGTLRRVAEGLNCTLVYALVPSAPLENMLRERACALVDERLARTQHSMKLENQALEASDLQTERERLVEEMLGSYLRRLWNEARVDEGPGE
jgi:predicted DNA-binding mobile mystery protein A